ncbi:hypothetical protein [Denitromonas iodatirespirans]|uniref:Uncharacterized protein n=1 Tax=Denitromonas iodatirespirans TaxID=2795389 RepID=A0A944DDN5_DENI1|nr:hypothetical protein [Denitromonas iodatirespirans]MBT0962563.1 hypothetical protein [Denitromonas iodatirespirans]
MSSAWSCPHDLNGICQRVKGAICSPGMRGCELEGKVRFARDEMNLSRKPRRARPVEAEKKAKDEPARKRRLPF